MYLLMVRKRTNRALKAALLPALALLLALVLAVAVNTAVPAPALALGAVTPLNGWPVTPQMSATTGNLSGTFSVSDGIDRLVVILVCCFDSNWNNGQTFNAAYGGKTLTQAVLQNNNRRQTWIGYLKENDIASRAGDAVTVVVNGAHTQVRGYIASYAGVDQTAPIMDSDGVYLGPVTSGGIVGPGGPLNVSAGGYGIYGWSCSSNHTRQGDDEDYGEDSDVNNTGGGTLNYGLASRPFAAGGATNPTVTWSNNNYVSVSFVTLNPDSTYPLPTTTSISPTSRGAGDPSFTLTVNGSNFVNGVSVVRLDGADRTTAFVSTTQLTATIPSSDLATMGSRSITVFTPAPGGGTSNAQTLTVGKATPVITWANPADIVYGTALSSTELCAAASVPGSFVYTPAAGAKLSAGDSQNLHVDFIPIDNANYNETSANVSINVRKAALTITAGSMNKTYSDSVSFEGTEFVADGLINGDTVISLTLTSDGARTSAAVAGSPYTIVASVAAGSGLANYNISYIDGTLTVTLKALTITANDRAKTYGDAITFAGTEFKADGLVNGDTVASVTLSSAGAADYATGDGSPYNIIPSGAVGTGMTNYSITYVNGSLTVNPASISMDLSASRIQSTRGNSVTFTAKVTVTGATGTVTFLDGDTVLGGADLSDGTAVFTTSKLRVGNHSITAVYSGDANFGSSTSSAADLEVKPVSWFSWMLMGWIIAAAVVCLFFLLVVYRRRRKRTSKETAISRAMGVVFNDEAIGGVALSTVEEVSTYPIQIERELESSMRRVEKSMEGAIQAICRTVETKDPYVSVHQKRVSQFACDIAREMGLPASMIDGIRVAGLVHDIGKVTVPTEILTKPGKLSRIELAMIQDHPRVAYDILKNVEFNRPIARIVVQHHERLDGSGYPDGISGDDILLEARVLAVADVVEAMCTDRPYRPALKTEAALDELDRGDGTLYDSEVVRACKKLLNERGFKVELTSVSA
jgi:hypothetical protein